MQHRIPLLAGLIVSVNLLSTMPADAQLPWRWFGPKAADKSKPALPDPRRAMEVNVEIAWLGDPITFPYYLEARADSKKLEVRGYVPNAMVREHAVRIAQVYSSLPVIDAMKEHPSLLVKPTQMGAQQLQSSVQASLRVALPRQYQKLRIECGGDGKVFISGPVNNLEERMSVSQALRRLHGCTSVQNGTALPNEQAVLPRERLPIVKTSNATEVRLELADGRSKSWWPFGKAGATEEPPLLETHHVVAKKPAPTPLPAPMPAPMIEVLPIELPSAAVKPPPPPPSVPIKTAPLSVAELRRVIQAACPKVIGVEIELTSAKEARVTLEIRNEADLAATAEHVFAVPELQNLRLDLQFKITAP